MSKVKRQVNIFYEYNSRFSGIKVRKNSRDCTTIGNAVPANNSCLTSFALTMREAFVELLQHSKRPLSFVFALFPQDDCMITQVSENWKYL